MPLFQNEFKCETFHMKLSASQSHFHNNGFVPRLALKHRHKGTSVARFRASGP